MTSWLATSTRAVSRYVMIIFLAVATGGALMTPSAPDAGDGERDGASALVTVRNESGFARTINVAGFPVFAVTNPFFQDLGINGRRCVTCHQPDNNMTVTPESIRTRFEATNGHDPIFRTNDGSNSPRADVSSVEARRQAYSMLLTKGLIRVGLPIPEGAEFELVDVHDPYGFASATELSLFRRPLPSTNLAFLSTVMWDGRETLQRGSPSAIHFDLSDQSNSATTGHAQRPAPIADAVREAIVAYEMGLFTAQVFDRAAGKLDAHGAGGGPDELSRQTFVFGVNDPLGCDANGANCTGGNAGFDRVVFTEFDAWTNLVGHSRNRARAAVARGQALFNTKTILIQGVSGINDDFNVTTVPGTCTVCHDTPHAGDHSVPAPLDIGVAAPPGVDGLNEFGLPVDDMPVYTMRKKGTIDQIKVVTDPGRALITGKWKDVGRFKGPTLRGLAGRGPYFHNGAAATLLDVVNFYDRRFNIGLSDQEKADLVAFLKSL